MPHTGLSFDHLHTNWEFLLPRQVDDEGLIAQTSHTTGLAHSLYVLPTDRPLPVISGLVALIKVFLCVVDLLTNGFPGSPPRAFAMTSGSLRPHVYPENAADSTYTPADSTQSSSTVGLSALLQIIRKLHTTIEELPKERICILDPQLLDPHRYSSESVVRAHQFDTISANIHITSLYTQSTILEACSNAFTNPQAIAHGASPGDASRPNQATTPRTQLWMFRKSIATELLEVLKFCSSRTSEANGSSMVSVSSPISDPVPNLL